MERCGELKSESAHSDSDHDVEHEHEHEHELEHGVSKEPDRAEHETLEALDAGRPRKVICYT